MALTRLLIRDFRNIAYADLFLGVKFNFFIGRNGSGKTNLLEAIYTLGHGKGFRTSQTGHLIRHDAHEFVLHARLKKDHETALIGLSKNRQGETQVRIDGSSRHKFADLAKMLPIQLMTPEGFSLLLGGPRFRRAFLDWGCFHHQSEFFNVWANFKKLLRQRNALLQNINCYDHIYPWDKELIPLAQRISEWRKKYIEMLVPHITARCAVLLPELSLNFSFQQGWDPNRAYGELLKNQFERDKILAYTNYGPHKADFRVRAEGKTVENILSRGQLKLLICALRLAQGELLTQQTGLNCFYLLDDFPSELDATRGRLLIECLKSTQAQFFINTINNESIVEMVNDTSKIFLVEDGKIALQP
ncbi:DNA replication/repair protein RecF [Candidatus Williamhamiltonella defendens]|uniref:DNA replication and repair protein RecF n=1 Tax=Candidatus Williamhamiltonella defendens TaxID=138072 RepID=A0AAC9VHB9_9ENTR|nr:DNA replication/repair protein RecF [Candidatus Hamiltonella defensa]ASV33008.1 DNA replication/repair protein RecF [Candidatus Hamiltonella defensa]AWK15961.1 DNA replication/repair protein RecF [Candidatus Hamiltonella defensa]